MKFSFDEVHPSWHHFFEEHLLKLDEILHQVEAVEIAPTRDQIFRAFRTPRERVRVLIVGQDPYPTQGVADGLAFSTSSATNSLPASLRNIFREYADDLNLALPDSGDLSAWSEEGVMLLNRTLTTIVGERNAHQNTGWKSFTDSVAKKLGSDGVVAILWGAHAQELSPYFTDSIQSVHPSPLSAYRGFFGSKPFSRANDFLIARGRDPIRWQL